MGYSDTLLANGWLRLGVCLMLMLCGSAVFAQPGPQAGQAGPRGSARESAQVDLTGYWVALVTEDWVWRMTTPARGDRTSVPLNREGVRVADQWDPGRDVANGEQCRPFGAAGLMRLPLRLRITWENDDTLRIDTDAGQQTRLLHFAADAAAPAERTWQGHSTAEWTRPVGGGLDLLRVVVGGGGPPERTQGPPMGSLKVETRNLRAGYLRKNGIPYSENTRLTEYLSRMSALGNDYLTILTIVHDPTYLTADFITSSHFKREPDGSKWNPSPCRTAPPRSPAGE